MLVFPKAHDQDRKLALAAWVAAKGVPADHRDTTLCGMIVNADRSEVKEEGFKVLDRLQMAGNNLAYRIVQDCVERTLSEDNESVSEAALAVLAAIACKQHEAWEVVMPVMITFLHHR